jgi:hypothetical protein
VLFRSWKRTVIEIVEAHISGASGGAAVSNNLRLSNIPNVLGQIDAITTELNSLADNGDLFAAENSFKELKPTLTGLSARRADLGCCNVRRTAPETVSRQHQKMLALRSPRRFRPASRIPAR